MCNGLKRMWDIVAVACFRYYVGIYLNGLTVTIGGLGEDIRCPVRDTNTEPHNYTSELSLHEAT
jgi:hypothetical protein